MTTEQEQALQLATEAGHILLENGAEIGRVEETMKQMSSAYGIEDESFFVLSNGIIATGQHYARAEFIPIKGTQLDKVVEVNSLSREVAAKPLPIEELAKRIADIRSKKGKPWWEQTLGIALGVSAFCIIFGGSLSDAAVAFGCGLVLGLYITLVMPHLSRIIGNLLGGLVGGGLCILATCVPGLSLHLPNMVIGTIIALVPGVPFTNGIRDLANEDYIAGTTRLTDAFLVFLCTAMGVALSLVIEGMFSGGIIELSSPVSDDTTSAWPIQLAVAFIGTLGFSALFGAPRRTYLACGLTGMAGWAAYLALCKTGLPLAAFAGGVTVSVLSFLLARLQRCPATVFLVCGIIPLVPGGGIFWTAYHIVANHLRQAATTGFMALKITGAIAGAIILVSALTSHLKKKTSPYGK